MSVWLCIPSKRPPEEAERVLSLWRRQGYKIALWRDDYPGYWTPEWNRLADHFRLSGLKYPGYAVASNVLIKDVLALDPSCDWVVGGGDDVEPDMNHTADEIAKSCSHFFRYRNMGKYQNTGDDFVDTIAKYDYGVANKTFGVMQPTGDRFAGGQIDRICGSPWIGREFAQRINGGTGPWWQGKPDAENPAEREGYKHMFVDEELQHVALKYGVLWQRPDLIHLHRHFTRESEAINANSISKPRPTFLDEANSKEHWRKYEMIFKTRRAQGFPGSEPL